MMALAAVTTGCNSFGLCAKRESELNCPTDVRKTVPWCAGEDAVFVCPCGPEGNFYGHRPTCWRDWPTTAAAWRDMSCGPTVVSETTTAGEPNPFRGTQVVPTPAPERMPDPIELPPLPTPEPQLEPQTQPLPQPLLQPKAIEESAQPDVLGPPVLPPKTSAIQQPASTAVAATAPETLPVEVAAPRDTKIKFVAAKSRLTAPVGQAPAPFVEPAAAAVEVVDETMVNHADFAKVVDATNGEETANFLAPADEASAPQQTAGSAPQGNEPLGTASPTFVRPSIKVQLLR